MKQLIHIALFSMLPVTAIGQSFNDCSLQYHEKYNKVSYELGRYFITSTTADSLRVVLDAELQRCIIGKELPPFGITGLSGETYTNENLKGKVVMINFWSVNCGPCLGEIPVFNRLHLSYRDNKDFVFISILLDKEEALKKFLEKGFTKRRIVYDVVPDSKALMKDTFKLIKAFPTNLFIDREGKIFMKTVGGIIDSKDEERLEMELRSIIDNELNKGTTAH